MKNWLDLCVHNEAFNNPQEIQEILNFKIKNPIKTIVDSTVLIPIYYRLLTKEEERILFIKMNYCRLNKSQNQEYVKMAYDARDAIINHNMGLVLKIAGKFATKERKFEEIVSDGSIGLIAAVSYFDVSKQNESGATNKFSTYATYAIIRHILKNELNKKRLKAKSLEEDDDYPQEVDTHITDDCFIVRVQGIVEPREYLLLRKYFGINTVRRTLDEIGSDLKLSKERIRQLKIQSLSLLRKTFCEED